MKQTKKNYNKTKKKQKKMWIMNIQPIRMPVYPVYSQFKSYGGLTLCFGGVALVRTWKRQSVVIPIVAKMSDNVFQKESLNSDIK